MTTDMIDELLADARERMTKSVEATRVEFGSVRTGRASPAPREIRSAGSTQYAISLAVSFRKEVMPKA